MAESFYDYLRREDPELMDKFHFQAKVGEFPKSRMVFKEEQLPLEEYDTFSEDPLEFEEYAAALAEDIHEIYNFSRFLNRFSEKYQTVSLQLEKGLAKLAGCCVTKAILEKKGFAFPSLEKLSIRRLYCAVSFNFRKVHAAISETKNRNYKMWGQLIDLEFGWHALAERLKVTEEKILNIQSGKINIDAEIDRIRLFREKKGPAGSPRPHQAVPSGKPYAFPVSGAVIREMIPDPDESLPGGTAFCRRGLSPLDQTGEQEAGIEPPLRHYDSIKQRKKAERLARKHARKAETKETVSGFTAASRRGLSPLSQQKEETGCGEKGKNAVPLRSGSGEASSGRSPLIPPGLPVPDCENIDVFELLKEKLERGSWKIPVPGGGPSPERA